jgi:hypothetical protein
VVLLIITGQDQRLIHHLDSRVPKSGLTGYFRFIASPILRDTHSPIALSIKLGCFA